jgi:AraC-like DNA-binding protein
MLSVLTHLRADGVELAEVLCSHARGRGQTTEPAGGYAIVFVRRGCFSRCANGVETLLDPTVAYCMTPGQEQRYDHPHDHGDECTSLSLSAELAASFWGGEPDLPAHPIPVDAGLDLAHRTLLAQARRGVEPDALAERAIALCAALLRRAGSERVDAGRRSSARAHTLLAEQAREILTFDRERSLGEIARELAVSPHHLSRVFQAQTGHGIARHRLRLRVRDALERLSEGERDLARLAADVGFADHAHMCRAIRDETGSTPAALRALLHPV